MTTSLLPISTPAEQGVDPTGIVAFVDALEAAEAVEPHSLLLLRHGHVIASGAWAPHRLDRNTLLYSVSKSFTGTALGIAIGEGLLGLDDLVADHLPDTFAQVTDPRLRALRIRHVASMSTGHTREMLLDSVAADPLDPLRGFLRLPVPREPGTVFAYNQPATYALATVLQRLTGGTLAEYLRPRLFDPLGIAPVAWSEYPRGREIGFSGLHTTTEAVAKLAQLYLQDGVWDGRRILASGWAATASTAQIDTWSMGDPDWRQGYGFQFWIARHGYRGDGAFGQFAIVLPEQDAVLAITAETERMQAVLDAAWRHLLPAMDAQPVAGAGPGPDADAGAGAGAATSDRRLAERLTGLRLPTAGDLAGGGPVVDVRPSGELEHGTEPWDAGLGVALETGGTARLSLWGETLTVPLTETWTVSDVPAVIATCATRLPSGRIRLDLAFLETPHRLMLEIDESRARLRSRWSTPPLFPLGGITLDVLRAPRPLR